MRDGAGRRSPDNTLWHAAVLARPSHGSLPANISYISTPNANTSDIFEYCWCSICSGPIHFNGPTRVRVSFASSPSSTRDMPKSDTFGLSLSPNRILLQINTDNNNKCQRRIDNNQDVRTAQPDHGAQCLPRANAPRHVPRLVWSSSIVCRSRRRDASLTTRRARRPSQTLSQSTTDLDTHRTVWWRDHAVATTPTQ